jgi:hypothetical protein
MSICQRMALISAVLMVGLAAKGNMGGALGAALASFIFVILSI